MQHHGTSLLPLSSHYFHSPYIRPTLTQLHPSGTGYIGKFEIIDDHRSGKIVIQLNGRLNKTGVISPRFNVQVTQIESWVNLLLPARGFGIIILVCFLYYSILLSSELRAEAESFCVLDQLLGDFGP